MNQRALVITALGSLALTVAVAMHGAPRPPAGVASGLPTRTSPMETQTITEPSRAAPAVIQPNDSNEIGKLVQYSQISIIPDKSYYLYFFSPT